MKVKVKLESENVNLHKFFIVYTVHSCIPVWVVFTHCTSVNEMFIQILPVLWRGLVGLKMPMGIHLLKQHTHTSLSPVIF